MTLRSVLKRHTGIQNSRDYCGINVGNELFHNSAAITHRHTGHAYIVFDRHALAFQQTIGCPIYVTLPVPRRDINIIYDVIYKKAA